MTGTGHPYEPTMAVSGIDSTIKIFNPDRNAQEQAKQGINILDPDNPANVLGSTVHNLGGLSSRKRLHDSYRIISQNDVDRRGGMSEAYITVCEIHQAYEMKLITVYREACSLDLRPPFEAARVSERVSRVWVEKVVKGPPLFWTRIA